MKTSNPPSESVANNCPPPTGSLPPLALSTLGAAVWALGKWPDGALLSLRRGTPRVVRELLRLAGRQYRVAAAQAPGEEVPDAALDPLAHLCTGKSLSEWRPDLPWAFPELRSTGAPNGEPPFILLCPATDLPSHDEPVVETWVRIAAWLEHWVAPVRLVGRAEDAALLFRLRHLLLAHGLASGLAEPLWETPVEPLAAAVKQAGGVVGPVGGISILAACLGVPTLIGYPEDLADLRGRWEPRGARTVSCRLAELAGQTEAGALNPGWTLKPAARRSDPPKAPDPHAPPAPSGPGIHPLVAPLGARKAPQAWAGRSARKPWEYRVTAVIPHLDTLEPLRACVELLRCQTERPFIMVIDTGSPDSVRAALEAVRAEDVEVHYIRAHAYLHPSEPVAAAQDLAFALCRTEYLFCTHADCFLRRRDFLEWQLTLCSPERPAVGYQMSPRDWLTDQWEGMVSHTATLLHMPSMHRLGVTWSLERARAAFHLHGGAASGWPDTETCMNLVLRQAGVLPHLIGDETNFRRHVDENLDHVRSYPGSQVYSDEYHQRARGWMEAALREAWERVVSWRAEAAG